MNQRSETQPLRALALERHAGSRSSPPRWKQSALRKRSANGSVHADAGRGVSYWWLSLFIAVLPNLWLRRHLNTWGAIVVLLSAQAVFSLAQAVMGAMLIVGKSV